MADTPEGMASNDDINSDELQKGLAAAAASEVETTENEVATEPEVEVSASETATTEIKTEASPVEDWKAKYEEREKTLIAESNQLAERAYNDLIRRTAAKNAAAYEALTGEKPPPDMFPGAPKPVDPAAKPEDALAKDLAD